MKLIYAIFLCLLLVGCQPAVQSEVESLVPSSTSTMVATQTAQPTESATLTPSITPTPPIPTLIPNPTIPDRYEQARRLGRGVNLGNALEAPVEGEWGMVLQEEYFTLIREAGFNTVRVPIRWSAHAEADPPYTIDVNFFERVDWVIDQALRNELNVVINMHHYDEIFEEPNRHQTRFTEIWKSIAQRYKNTPTQVYYELLNEPHGNLTQTRWEKLMAETILAIRRIDNTHTIIVGGADWGGINGLFSLNLPEGDKNLICTFHFYDPMLFTHQGAEWVSVEYSTLNVVWPGPPKVEVKPNPEAEKTNWVYTWFSQYNFFPYETNPAGPKPIVSTFDWARRTRNRLDCPVWLGEFGAYGKADMQSRINWTSFVREKAESFDIPWAYWEFGAGFGIYDRENGSWREGLLNALIPE
jgi:endoglucanase